MKNAIVKKMMSLAVISALIMGLAGCTGSNNSTSGSASEESTETTTQEQSTDNTDSSEAKELVVVDWGGANTDARIEANFKPFEEEYNCKITVVTPCDYAKLQTMVDTNTVEWDVMNCDAYWGVLAGSQSYLEEIDYDVVTANLNPETTSQYVCSAETYSSAISWNTDKYSQDTSPKSWADFWDTEKYPGKRAMWKYPVTVLEAALMADGVAAEDLYPLDTERAFAKLDEIKDDIVWWSAGAEPAQMLSTGEADLALAWSGRIANAKEEGSPVDFTYNQAVVISAGWVIPKGAPHAELAQEFLNYISSPEMMLAFSEKIPYGASNLDTPDLMSDELKVSLGLSEEQTANEIYLDNAYWAENLEELEEEFNAWLLE